jgi:long-subunit acyl-CoA synthetase (AMP-forming)
MQTEGIAAFSRDIVASRRPKPNVTAITPGDLPIERVLRWERERAHDVYMVQPLGGTEVREYTWGETVSQARRLAKYLRELGHPPGSRIAILSKNCAQFMIADLAIWMAGYVSVPLYPTVGPDTIRYVLDHCDAKALFVGKLDEWEKQQSGVPARVHCFSCRLSPQTSFETIEDIVARTEPLAGHPVRRPEDIATIIYTSGSTGVPKGVVHDFAGIAAAIKGAVVSFGLVPSDRVISYLPLAHAFERTVIETCSFVVGFRVYFAESVETFVKDIQRARPTLFHSVPRLWLKFQAGVHSKLPPGRLRLLLSIPMVNSWVRKKVLTGLGLDQARAAITGSAPIPAELVAWYRSLGLELCEGYGMTENFSYSHFNRPGDAVPGTVGPPAPDVECKLGDDGEILVKSPANMLGYYREPEMTREAFTDDGFLRTGDRGVIEPDGRLRIVGRTKEIFKTSKGKYIAPAPIESALQATGVVELAAVTGTGLPQPVAVVSLAEALRPKAATEEGKREIEAQLRQVLETVNAQLAAHEKLARLYVSREAWTVESGLLTPTLKIKRAELDKRYGSHIKEEGPPLVWID